MADPFGKDQNDDNKKDEKFITDGQWTNESTWSSSDDNWKPDQPFSNTDEVTFGSQVDGNSTVVDDSNPDFDEGIVKGNAKKKGPKLDLPPASLCTIISVSNAVQGTAVGCLVGGVSAIVEGAQHGALREPGFLGYARGQSWSRGKQFGGWLAVYSGAKCALRVTHGGNDMMNSFVAGFLAGTVGVLRTRHPPTIIFNGLSSGAIMGVMSVFNMSNF